MSRIELGGYGEPIPLEALPNEFSADTTPLLLSLPNGVDFVPADYISFGYTHYEVYCIGAVGGRGGDCTIDANFLSTTVQVVSSPTVWNLYRELTRIVDYFTAGEWDHVYSFDSTPSGARTAVQELEHNNPTHKLPVTTYTGAVLLTNNVEVGRGGSGGGGGLHVVSGLLDDLDAAVPVVVGTAPADIGYGQTVVNGLWTPLPHEMDLFTDTSDPYPYGRMHELYNYFTVYKYKYPGVRTSFAAPVVGANGGASSFGGSLCRASGGKGGAPGRVWGGSAYLPNAIGGEGGSGDRILAGGGAAGSASASNGSDGVWDGAIGQGGGGGRGGAPGAYGVGGSLWVPSNGGQGSYSFADTSMFGIRQYKSAYIGGTGGGAKPLDKKFGSRALGYSPDGAVIIRLYKVA